MISRRVAKNAENIGTQMNTDSFKMLWRVSECPKQARLASPCLAPHALPTLPLCKLRFARPLSSYRDRDAFFRQNQPQVKGLCCSVPQRNSFSGLQGVEIQRGNQSA
jgi:hypothetical protein